MNSIQDNPSQLIIGGSKRIISASMVCTNCGFTSQKNLAVLGFSIEELSLSINDND